MAELNVFTFLFFNVIAFGFLFYTLRAGNTHWLNGAFNMITMGIFFTLGFLSLGFEIVTSENTVTTVTSQYEDLNVTDSSIIVLNSTTIYNATSTEVLLNEDFREGMFWFYMGMGMLSLFVFFAIWDLDKLFGKGPRIRVK